MLRLALDPPEPRLLEPLDELRLELEPLDTLRLLEPDVLRLLELLDTLRPLELEPLVLRLLELLDTLRLLELELELLTLRVDELLPDTLRLAVPDVLRLVVPLCTLRLLVLVLLGRS